MASQFDFTWVDGERLVRFGPRSLDTIPYDAFDLLTTERGESQWPELVEAAAAVFHVPSGPVPEAAASVRQQIGEGPIVALGGGRVIDAAKGIAGADDLVIAAVPTTLSGAPMTAIHRMPAGYDGWSLVRPSLVIADPDLMSSQEPQPRAASAMNALAHAAEALYGPMANPAAEAVALRAAEHLARGLEASSEEKARPELALGAILAGYAVGSAGFALHHLLGQTLVRVTGVSHAGAYAVLLPFTLEAMLERATPAITKLGEALGLGARNPAAVPARVGELAALAGPRRLSELGMEEGQIDDVVAAALERPDLANTPNPPDADELRALLREAF
ncbi:MAG: maleylacetate reductase [Thermoleophilaceae bacterium]|nr:maleylacetate reductase [Thermoleophilaceae bacterium]